MRGFEDSDMAWFETEAEPGVKTWIYSVDAARNTTDFIIKFEPNTKIIVHRHCALTHMLVLEGDHVIYEPDGSLRESRPTGRYTISPVTGDIHTEGGGPDGCTLFYSVRGGDDDLLFDVVDGDFNMVSQLRTADFQLLLDAQAES